MEKTLITSISSIPSAGAKIMVEGWVRSVRDSKNVAFVMINDGTTMESLQIVLGEDFDNREELVRGISVGAAIRCNGTLVDSPGKGQKYEIQAHALEIVGTCDETYPLQKKRHSMEFLRTISHLRVRSNIFGAVFRVRSRLAYAIHKFFNERNFLYVHSPIITASDCEGAGQMFRVSTLDPANPPRSEDGTVDYSQDFFGKATNLTVSGQLEAEIFAQAFTNVYTFGPTFRAENSNTPRHMAEFWMIEPEIAFCDLAGDRKIAEEFIKFLISDLFENRMDDLEFFDQWVDKGLIQRLQHVLSSPFECLTYTEAIEKLKASGKVFEFPVEWGCDLQTEHERFLTEELVKKPVFVIDYPQEIKSFYMRLNEDGKTVAAMDLLVPKIGEIIGGSQREERLDVLERRMVESGLNKDDYWWYNDLRRYGSTPHAGFGLGFERMVMYCTGMENIRDVTPFPRTPKNCDI
ncbi:MAG: asparagine--tRNA ligase [Candidatus Wallbacteria bacterium HGW-Wallbacteria-1]|jgi:asparaginyl-tRNA synthetase|uniref:Asparagine--tRNA ligase n=1 Tax=Candidatus Wallbacteria bacterium HGW-Wallbacteria-1 TaxID=2013854 RepID=A0A2N1PNX9_9BACT|nr:MAG: asparagine--tRNA ligase [Candidatus Wallbacteria bacterium HGW-Wallbacteria-1]